MECSAHFFSISATSQQQCAHESKGLLHLSDELEIIFSYLSDADICSMRLVCKKFRNIIDMTKKLHLKDFGWNYNSENSP